MKKTAKIIAFVLSLIMVMSVASAYVIYADAAGTPTLNITETGRTDDTVTVAVNVTGGSFNALDFQFNTSGVTCESISASGGYGNKANGKVSMASIDGYTGGNVITATFKLPEEGSYSISGSASSCTVTENGGNREVGASVSGGVSGSKTKPTEKPSTTKSTTKPSTTKSTTKPSTTKSTTKPSTAKPTSKSSQKSSSKNNQLINNQRPSSTPNKDSKSKSEKIDDLEKPTEEELTSIEETTLPEDEDVFGDDFDDDDWYSGNEDEDADGAETEDEGEGKDINKKAIAGIAGGAGALVAASVAAIVIANKKKNDDEF